MGFYFASISIFHRFNINDFLLKPILTNLPATDTTVPTEQIKATESSLLD